MTSLIIIISFTHISIVFKYMLLSQLMFSCIHVFMVEHLRLSNLSGSSSRKELLSLVLFLKLKNLEETYNVCRLSQNIRPKLLSQHDLTIQISLGAKLTPSKLTHVTVGSSSCLHSAAHRQVS